MFAALDAVVHVMLFGRLRHLASRVLDDSLVRETVWVGRSQALALGGISAGCFLAIIDNDFFVLVGVSTLLLMLSGIGAVILMFAFVRAFNLSAAAARAGELTAYALLAATASPDDKPS